MGPSKQQVHSLRRLAALVLCFLLCVTLLPTGARALEGSTGALRWSLQGGTLTVSGTGEMPEYSDANMPPWYDSADAINRVVVEQGVTSVGALAFYGCEALSAVSLPSGLTAIGDRAFKNCAALPYLRLPSGLTAIGDAAFESCAALDGITLPESLRSIGSYAFMRCTSLSSITVPAGVTDFGMVVFTYCTGLVQAVVRCPVEKLPDWTFYGCTALAAVSLPSSVKTTGENAFYDCENLDTVYYSGPASDTLDRELGAEEATRRTELQDNGEAGIGTSSSSTFDEDTATKTTTTVTNTENSTITEKTQTSYTYTVDGEDTPMDNAFSAAAAGVDVGVDSKSSTTISAILQDPEGWGELTNAADSAVTRQENENKDRDNPNSADDGTVKIDVRLDGSTVSGKDLDVLVSDKTMLTVTTGDGCTWRLDAVSRGKDSFVGEEYDLNFSVKKLSENDTKIESDSVYQVNFATATDFGATVKIPLAVSEARQYATLYARNRSEYTQLATVIVDENGFACLPVGALNKKTDYYIGINVPGADTAEALIPESLRQEYGVDYTLTDASGQQYEVGARTSRWGITGRQFAIYVAIAFGAIVLVVSGVTITLHKMKQSKMKYAALATEDTEDEINEDALRLKIMQEMLEEAKKQKEKK